MVVLTSFTQPTDGIRHQQQNTTVYVNNNNLGKGTLFIAESRLSWISESGNGFSIEYPHIALHAVSRDLSAFPQECLFLMLDAPLEDEDQNGEEDGDAEGDDSGRQETTEMRLVPDDAGMLDAMFHAMNACQALHPDPADSFSDEDFFEDADEETSMEEADSQMARLRIGNMDVRPRMEDMAEGRAECRAECRTEGWAEGERVGSMALGIWEGREVGRVGGIWVDREEDREGGIWVDREEDREGGIWVDREEDREVGRVGGIWVDREEDREGGRFYTWGGMEGDTEGDMEEDMEEGSILVGRGVDRGEGSILVGRAVDRGVDREEGSILGGGGVDRVVGRGADMEVGTARGGRSFLLGSTLHRDSTAEIPLAHPPHTIHSNFDDAEN